MRTLRNTFHITFWLCVACIALLATTTFVPRDSSFFGFAAYGLPGLLLGGLVYAAAVGMLADKHGKSGALWGGGAFLFGPVGLVLSYVRMLRLLRSGTPASGSFLPQHAPAQKKRHWQLFIVFMVVLVVANVAVRLFR